MANYNTDYLMLDILAQVHEWTNEETDEVRECSACDLHEGDWVYHCEAIGWVFLAGYDRDEHAMAYDAYPEHEPERGWLHCSAQTLRDYVIDNTEIEDQPDWSDVYGLE